MGKRKQARTEPTQTIACGSVAYGRPTTATGQSSRDLRRELAETLQAGIAEQAERLQETLANLEIALVGGYFVKVWPDLEAQVWIAHCPTVRCVVQEGTRDEALTAIAESIADMLEALSEMGAPLPPRDVRPE